MTLVAYKKESVIRYVVLDSRNVPRLTVPQLASSPPDISPTRQLPDRTFL